MPPSRPLLSDLVSRVTTDVEASTGYTTPLLPVSVLRVLAKVFAGAVHLLYGFCQFMAAQIFPDTAESSYLDEWASIWGITRQAATFPVCNLTVTGVNTSTIPEGTLWVALSGVEFESTAGATIAGGTATVPVTATTSGSVGNPDSGDTMALVNPVAGVNSSATVAVSGIVDGQDAETDAALLTRLLARIQDPPQGGSEADYVAWARSIAGVTRAWVTILSPGNLQVRFVTDNAVGGPIPDAGTIAAVQAYLNTVRPVTANVTALAPSLETINFTIALAAPTDEIKAAITAGLTAYIAENGYPGQTLLQTRFIQIIAENAGTSDFTMPEPSASVALTTSEFGQIGTITWA